MKLFVNEDADRVHYEKHKMVAFRMAKNVISIPRINSPVQIVYLQDYRIFFYPTCINSKAIEGEISTAFW